MINHTDWLRRTVAALTGAKDVLVYKFGYTRFTVVSEFCGFEIRPCSLDRNEIDTYRHYFGEPYSTIWLRKCLTRMGWP